MTTYSAHEQRVLDLDSAAILDLLSDARCAERQAVEGPFYPDRGITTDSLKSYAAKCRAEVEKFKTGGAHNAVVRGEA